MHLYTHGARRTRDYLTYRNLSVPGQVVESVMLPTMELLVLTFQQDGSHEVHLLDGSELLPVMQLEGGIPPRHAAQALAYHAATLLSPGRPMVLDLERSRNY